MLPPVRHIDLPESNDAEQLAQEPVPTSDTPAPVQEADTTHANTPPLVAVRTPAKTPVRARPISARTTSPPAVTAPVKTRSGRQLKPTKDPDFVCLTMALLWTASDFTRTRTGMFRDFEALVVGFCQDYYINLSNFYSANIPGVASLSCATARSVFK